jgi:hypothetical protein
VVARRIVLPAATVAVAGVVTVSGAVAFASGPSASADRPRPTAAASATGPRTRTATDSVTVAGQPVAARGAETAAPTETAAITAAIHGSDLTSHVPPSDYQVTDIRISRADPTWAYAELLPVTDTIDRAHGVLHHTARGWRLMELGTYEVGCTVVPAPARADLGLDECPPTGLSA